MTLTVVLGDVGSGKTLIATILAIRSNKKIYANYTIKDEKFTKIEPIDLATLNEKAIIIIDEAYDWLESRISGRDINRFLSYILFQSRKRGIDFTLTAQLFSTIDVRFRQMANYFILAEEHPDGFAYKLIKNSLKHYGRVSFLLPFSEAEKYYDKYDTFEIINPIDDNMLEAVASTPIEFNKRIDKIIKELKSKFTLKKYTLPFVKNYLVRNNYSLKYASFIHTRINLTE